MFWPKPDTAYILIFFGHEPIINCLCYLLTFPRQVTHSLLSNKDTNNCKSISQYFTDFKLRIFIENLPASVLAVQKYKKTREKGGVGGLLFC